MMSDPIKSPTVDVIIPVFNGQDYIIQAIQSIETQTVDPNRIIVIDDGSTDNTGDLVRSYKCRIPLDYHSQENRGLSAARNAGITRSHAEFIAFLDADDVWYPQKIEKQLAVMANKEFSSLGVVYCQYDTIDQAGLPIKSFYIVAIDLSVRGNVFDKLLQANKVVSSGSGVLIRRDCFEKVGLFDERMQAFEDWDMWIRLAKYYQFDFSPDTLVRIRRHNNNMQRDISHMFKNSLVFFDKWIQNLPTNSRIPSTWVAMIVTNIVSQLPRLDFWRLYKTTVSSKAQYRFRYEVFTSHKKLLFFQSLWAPISAVRNIARSLFIPSRNQYAKL